ncbi:hypothetical protein NDU88_004646 [Pleurodeles waltl]|uniref:Uncharacterized protein n=1 Tax=Pleurodeles waltl TaxID=8319 RepID=A0AAV7NUC2_PLEWA|nr:hypothetical protein NDU88_004646 [Pleurodeles waltl]
MAAFHRRGRQVALSSFHRGAHKVHKQRLSKAQCARSREGGAQRVLTREGVRMGVDTWTRAQCKYEHSER